MLYWITVSILYTYDIRDFADLVLISTIIFNYGDESTYILFLIEKRHRKINCLNSCLLVCPHRSKKHPFSRWLLLSIDHGNLVEPWVIGVGEYEYEVRSRGNRHSGIQVLQYSRWNSGTPSNTPVLRNIEWLNMFDGRQMSSVAMMISK